MGLASGSVTLPSGGAAQPLRTGTGAGGGPASTGAGRCREQWPCPQRAGQGEGLAAGLQWLWPCNLKAEGSEMAPGCSRLCAPSARRLQVGDVTAVGFWGSARYKQQCKRTFLFSFFFFFSCGLLEVTKFVLLVQGRKVLSGTFRVECSPGAPPVRPHSLLFSLVFTQSFVFVLPSTENIEGAAQSKRWCCRHVLPAGGGCS